MSPGPFEPGTSSREPVAPVVPTAGRDRARGDRSGCSGAAIDGGIWADRRRLNHEVTIPHGAAQLEAAGNLVNFRLAAGGRRGRLRYRGGADDAGARVPVPRLGRLQVARGRRLGARPWRRTPSLVALAEPVDRPRRRARSAATATSTPSSRWRSPARSSPTSSGATSCTSPATWSRRPSPGSAALDDDRLLRVARARRRIESTPSWVPGARELVDGHPEIEMALVELYRTTGQERYLELARTLLERRGHGLLGAGRYGRRYWQDHEPVRSAPVPVGHAVRQMYLDCGVVDVAVETGDRELLEAVIRRWEAMVASRMYLTGGARVAPSRRGLRRRLRAAAGPRLRRDVRRDRQRDARLAPAAGHRREPLRRPDRAHGIQRGAARARPRRPPLLLREPAPAALPRGGGRSTAPRPPAARRGTRAPAARRT